MTPLIERHVKESINRTLIPAYQKSTSDMYDQLYQEINEEILNLKKEIITWQSDALKGQEVCVSKAVLLFFLTTFISPYFARWNCRYAH